MLAGMRVPWLGVYFEASSSWAYHSDHGWLYFHPSNNQNFWVYNHELKWVWTSSTVYPWVYIHEIKNWRYYSPKYGFVILTLKTGRPERS